MPRDRPIEFDYSALDNLQKKNRRKSKATAETEPSDHATTNTSFQSLVPTDPMEESDNGINPTTNTQGMQAEANNVWNAGDRKRH